MIDRRLELAVLATGVMLLAAVLAGHRWALLGVPVLLLAGCGGRNR